jgi:hypothetical protein
MVGPSHELFAPKRKGHTEAPSRFGGNVIVGYFKIRGVPDCAGALDFTIRVQPLQRTPSLLLTAVAACAH